MNYVLSGIGESAVVSILGPQFVPRGPRCVAGTPSRARPEVMDATTLAEIPDGCVDAVVPADAVGTAVGERRIQPREGVAVCAPMR